MSSLAHHGVKGQKWGVRRFQNYDGTRTTAGKKREKQIDYNTYIRKARKEKDTVIKAGESLSRVTGSKEEINRGHVYVSILSEDHELYKSEASGGLRDRETGKLISKVYDTRHTVTNDIRIPSFSNGLNAFMKVMKDQDIDKVAQEVGNSYGSDNEKHTSEFKSRMQNLSSQKDREAAYIQFITSLGNSDKNRNLLFKELKNEGYNAIWDENDRSNGWFKEPIIVFNREENMKQISAELLNTKLKHSSIGGNMNYIYGNTLVLGDSSYLEHHGIKNQKWGIRRFQNPDGSLTAAGRIRYGVTGAAKAAFKIGKKGGSAVASAAKAGIKKAKDNAYAKKKEKASQTREGVLKNKKMFTADELKALETRFKIEDEMSEASLRHGQAVAKTVSQYANTTRDVLSALQTGGNAVSAITKAFADIQSYQNAKGVAEAAKEKGMTTKEFDLFLKEKYPNAKKDDGSKKKDKNSNKAQHSDPEDDGDDDNPPNNGGGGGSKKQAEYDTKRRAAQDTIYNKNASELKQREDYLNKRYDALLKVSKQRQSEQDARDEDLNRRDKAASEREAKLEKTAKTAADVMSKLNKRKADLDKKESFLNSIESYRLDTLSEFKKNEEEAARRKKKKVKHSAIGEEMYVDYLEHFGTKGMKWGVRRYQNPDGTLTEKGRKHYQKKLDLEERKLTSANADRGRYERVRGPLSAAIGAGAAIVGAIGGFVAGGPAGAAYGAAIVGAFCGSTTYAEYTVKGMVAGIGAGSSKKKIAKYKAKLQQDGFMVQNGVLIYGFDKSNELEHFGVKGQKWGIRRYQNPDGTRTALGKKRDQYGATVSIRGQKSSEHFGVTKKQARGKAAAEVLKNRSDLSDKERRSLQKHVDKASKETAKLNKYKEYKKWVEEENAEEAKVNQWNALQTGMMSPDRYKENIARIDKNYKREADYLDKMDERDMHNEKAFTAKTVAKGMGVALAVTAGLAGITAAATGTMVISGMAAAAGGTVGAISSELKRAQYRKQRRKEMGLDDSDPLELKGAPYIRQDGFQIQNGVLMYGFAPSDELEHFGLKGMKWGVRRFQNKDGSLTEAGKQRYANTGNLDSDGGGGGGAPEEEDEETKKAIEEAAKKAGMTVDEYRKKFADKVAALKEKARDAAWDARYAAEDAADAVTGKTSKQIAEKSAKSAEENEKKAAAARKEGRDEDAAKYEEWAKQSREISEYRQGKYEKSLAGRAEAASKKIGAKAQEAKDKFKSKAPKRSIALEVANTGPVPVGQTEIHTADVLNKYYGAMARARKTAANSTAAQRAKYGDRQNIRERAEAEELNNLRAREKRDEAIRLRMAKKFDKKADSARAHGNIAKAEAFEKESNRQFNKAPVAGSKAEAFEAVRDSKLASHLVRNAATAKRAQSATLAENRNRNAAHLAERRREKAINEAKAKIRSGKLPVNELTRYAKSSVGQLKSAAKAELARREREQALTSMGSDYARATARVTTTSSTTNTTDAHNEKLARDRRDKRKQAARASATAKKNRLAGSGRKKYTSSQTSSIGRVGSGRGKTSTRR